MPSSETPDAMQLSCGPSLIAHLLDSGAAQGPGAVPELPLHELCGRGGGRAIRFFKILSDFCSRCSGVSIIYLILHLKTWENYWLPKLTRYIFPEYMTANVYIASLKTIRMHTSLD